MIPSSQRRKVLVFLRLHQLKEECLLSWRREKIINLEIETFVLGKKATTAQQKVDDSVKVNVFKKFSTPQGVVQKATRI